MSCCEATAWVARRTRFWWRVAALLALAGAGGCRPASITPAPGSLLVTQVPIVAIGAGEARDTLDVRYPAGSRVVLVHPTQGPRPTVVLSAGLHAAGSPALAPDGQGVLFAGKASGSDAWQIYRVSVAGGPPVPITTLPGGAMDPAWLPGGRFVFSSPVPRLPQALGENPPAEVPALYSLAVTGGPPARLTFGLVAATDPTVLADGRILFVSGVPPEDGSGASATSLFTVNNDGTELTAFAGQHDTPAALRRPRETRDGRVVFLATAPGAAAVAGRIDQVLAARPFRSRSVTHPDPGGLCRSVEPLGEGGLLACVANPASGEGVGAFAILRLGGDASDAWVRVLEDPAWSQVDAVSATHAPRPTGRLSTIEVTRRDGLLLCLDAQLTDQPPVRPTADRGTRIRVVGGALAGPATRLGETPLQTDGSFLVNVPADVPLGIEMLDAQGRLVRRCPPAFWLRPGENRTCVGCHEPHNRAPENLRPLAVLQPPVPMLSTEDSSTQAPTSSP